jgi:hypothetical protein
MKALPVLRHLSQLNFDDHSIIYEEMLFDPDLNEIILKGFIIQHKPSKEFPIGIRRTQRKIPHGRDILKQMTQSLF